MDDESGAPPPADDEAPEEDISEDVSEELFGDHDSGSGDERAEDPAAGSESPAEIDPAAERRLIIALTAVALGVVMLAVYIVARLLAAEGSEVPTFREPHNSVAPGFEPISITFFGPTTGLASGRVPCETCREGQGGVIARTEDSGTSWQVVHEADRPVLSIARVGGDLEVWAAQSLCTSQAYTGCDIGYLRSVDGGRTWVSRKPPKNEDLVSPPPQPGPCQWDHPYPVSSSFPTYPRGWVLCSLKPTGMTEQYKGLYTTSNSGRNWLELPEFHPVTGGRTVNPGNMPTDGFPAGVSFLKSGEGLLWTHGPDSSLSVTHNGGKRWKRVWHSPESGDVRIISASLTAPGTGWALRRNLSSYELSYLRPQTTGEPIWEPAATWPRPD